MGCEKPPSSVYIVYENGSGIKAGDPILSNGIQIGEVKKVSLNDHYKVIIEAVFNDTFPVVDAQFFIDSKNILGDKLIRCEAGSSSQELSIGDTIKGSVEPEADREVNSINQLLETLGQLLSEYENDSLINLIESLKQRVDSLEHIRDSIQSQKESSFDS